MSFQSNLVDEKARLTEKLDRKREALRVTKDTLNAWATEVDKLERRIDLIDELLAEVEPA